MNKAQQLALFTNGSYRRGATHKIVSRVPKSGDTDLTTFLAAYVIYDEAEDVTRPLTAEELTFANLMSIRKMNAVVETEIEFINNAWVNETDTTDDNVDYVIKSLSGGGVHSLAQLVTPNTYAAGYVRGRFDLISYLQSLVKISRTIFQMTGRDVSGHTDFLTDIDPHVFGVWIPKGETAALSAAETFIVGAQANQTFVKRPNATEYTRRVRDYLQTIPNEAQRRLAAFLASIGIVTDGYVDMHGVGSSPMARSYTNDGFKCIEDAYVYMVGGEYDDDRNVANAASASPLWSQTSPTSSNANGAIGRFSDENVELGDDAYKYVTVVCRDASQTFKYTTYKTSAPWMQPNTERVNVGSICVAATKNDLPKDVEMEFALYFRTRVEWGGKDYSFDQQPITKVLWTAADFNANLGNVACKHGATATVKFSSVVRPEKSYYVPAAYNVYYKDYHWTDYEAHVYCYSVAGASASNLAITSVADGRLPFSSAAAACKAAGVEDLLPASADPLPTYAYVPDGAEVLKNKSVIESLVKQIEDNVHDESYDIVMRALQLRRMKDVLLQAYNAKFFEHNSWTPIARVSCWSRFCNSGQLLSGEQTIRADWTPAVQGTDYLLPFQVDHAVRFKVLDRQGHVQQIDGVDVSFTITRRTNAWYLWKQVGSKGYNSELPNLRSNEYYSLSYDFILRKWLLRKVLFFDDGTVGHSAMVADFTDFPDFSGSYQLEMPATVEGNECQMLVYDTEHGYPGFYDEDGYFIPFRSINSIFERIDDAGITPEDVNGYLDLNTIYASVLEHVMALSSNITGDATTDGQYILAYVDELKSQASAIRSEATQKIYGLRDASTAALYEAQQFAIAKQLETIASYVANVGSSVATQVTLGLSPADAIIQSDLMVMNSCGDIDGCGAIALATGGALSELLNSMLSEFGYMVRGAGVVAGAVASGLVSGLKLAAKELMTFNLAVQDAIGNLVGDGASITRVLTGDVAGYSSPVYSMKIALEELAGYTFTDAKSISEAPIWTVRVRFPINHALDIEHAYDDVEFGDFRIVLVSASGVNTVQLLIYPCRQVGDLTNRVLSVDAVPSDTVAAKDIRLSQLAWLSFGVKVLGDGYPGSSWKANSSYAFSAQYDTAVRYMNSDVFASRVLAKQRVSILGTSSMLLAGLAGAACFLVPGVGWAAGVAITGAAAVGGAVAGAATISQTYGNSGEAWRNEAISNAQNAAFTAADLDQLSQVLMADGSGKPPISYVGNKGVEDLQYVMAGMFAEAIGGGLMHKLRLTATSQDAADIISLCERLNSVGVAASSAPTAMYTFLTQEEYLSRVKKVAVGTAAVMATLVVGKLMLKRLRDKRKIQGILTTGIQNEEEQRYIDKHKRLAVRQWFGGGSTLSPDALATTAEKLDGLFLDYEKSTNDQLRLRIDALAKTIGVPNYIE